MKLITDAGNQHTLKALVAANLAAVNIECNVVNSADQVLPFLKKNRFPVLELGDDEHLFSANAICSYILGQSETYKSSVHIDEWLEWEATQLQPFLGPYLAAIYGSGKADVAVLESSLSHLNAKLDGKAYLVEDALSAADIVVWAALYPAATKNTAIIANYQHIQHWYQSLTSQDAFQQAVAKVTEGKGSSAFKASILAQPLVAAPKELTEKTGGDLPREECISHDVSIEEISAAREIWLHGHKTAAKPKKRVHPLLPEEGAHNILITSALPYVNNVPHLGNIIGCVLSADVFSRFCRLRNYNVLYVCGTDEYGTATETKAVEEGVTPQEICAKYFELHKKVYEWFDIDFDHFGRTTTPQQTEIAQDIFWRLHKNNYTTEDTVQQLLCQRCNRYLADRFVEGICPLCNYEDARGDQCDKCGKLIVATELKKPRCKVCGDSPIIKQSTHLFLDLPALLPQIEAFVKKSSSEGDWTANSKLIASTWIRDGLKPRCITRDLKWGTPVPLEGYTDKVFYVWFDAPIGYISITACYSKDWEKWWKNPQQVQMYNFMAKDNVPFHSIVFPGSLIGATDNYTLVNHLIATEYLNYEDGKFSKSRGVGVFGDQAKETGIPADIWRFYLLYVRPENQDSSFSWSDFVLKNNSELLNNLGNFINRALTFMEKNFGGVVPEMVLVPEDEKLLAEVTRELQEYIKYLDKVKIRDALRCILNISRLGNQHIQANKPWVLVKGSDADKTRAGTVIGVCVNISCLLSVMLQPYMPQTSKIIQQQLNADEDCNVLTEGSFVCYLKTGHKIGKPSPLFNKIEQDLVDSLKKRFSGQQSKAEKENTAPAAATTGGAANPADAERLEKEVTQQGEVVRKLKTEKADKEKIDVEVQKLLALKRALAISKGEDPDAKPAGAGKSKGKKKKGGKK
ncbi:methionine--tRNA ligase, cytoplasmic-like isoform X2 [Amphiura filiformis]|uniref:methionine--tRNA ligase, cytoplasmic-like isoform X2 n=1 Tax=Amphiura filiformis TaxID=82378 RepID=UPI003B21BE49